MSRPQVDKVKMLNRVAKSVHEQQNEHQLGCGSQGFGVDVRSCRERSNQPDALGTIYEDKPLVGI